MDQPLTIRTFPAELRRSLKMWAAENGVPLRELVILLLKTAVTKKGN